MNGLPGSRLHRVLIRCVRPAILHDVIEPSLADLQFEAARASTPAHRRRALIQGYLSIARVLIVVGLEPGGTLRAILALAVVCAAGAALTLGARAAHVDGRVVSSAILAPAMLAPIVLRGLGLARPGRLFWGSLISVLGSFVGGGGLHVDPSAGVWLTAVRLSIPILVFVPVAALTAIAAAPAAARATGSRQSLAAVALGSGVATVVFGLVCWPEDVTLPLGLAMTPFYLVLFTTLFSITLLPLLFIVRPFVAPSGMVAAAIICSPLPFIAGHYLDHQTLADCLASLRHSPSTVAASSLPFVFGAVAVGWASRPRGQPA